MPLTNLFGRKKEGNDQSPSPLPEREQKLLDYSQRMAPYLDRLTRGSQNVGIVTGDEGVAEYAAACGASLLSSERGPKIPYSHTILNLHTKGAQNSVRAYVRQYPLVVFQVSIDEQLTGIFKQIVEEEKAEGRRPAILYVGVLDERAILIDDEE
jgi:hypothetical protein